MRILMNFNEYNNRIDDILQRIQSIYIGFSEKEGWNLEA